jgi:hypothetical protein
MTPRWLSNVATGPPSATGTTRDEEAAMHDSRPARQGRTRHAAPAGILLTGVLVLAGCSSRPKAADPAQLLAEYHDARGVRALRRWC